MCDSAELYEGNENCQWQCACRLATITTSPFLTDRVMWGCVRLSELPSSLFMMNSMCSLQWEYTEQGMFTARFSAPGPNTNRKDTCLKLCSGVRWPVIQPLCFTSETCVSLIQWRSTQKLVTWDENIPCYFDETWLISEIFSWRATHSLLISPPFLISSSKVHANTTSVLLFRIFWS